MNRILGKNFPDDETMLAHITNDKNKTTCAVAVFGTTEAVSIPEYILNAIH